MKSIFSLSFLVFTAGIALGQCPMYLALYNQAQIDNIKFNYSHCTEIETIIIDGTNSDITDLIGIRNYERINGGLYIGNTDCEYFQLPNLGYIGTLNVVSNSKLDSFAFPVLDSIKNEFYLAFNNDLDVLNGFGSLEYSQNNSISSNINLTYIDNFNNLIECRSIHIGFNPELISIKGLDNVDLTSSLNISVNNKLEEISGFNSTTELERLKICGSPDVISFPCFQNLVRIDSFLVLRNLPNLNIDGFYNLAYVGDDFNIEGLGSMSNGTFGSLDTVSNDFSIRFATGVTTLDNFSSLVFIGGDINLSANASLSDCAILCDMINNPALHYTGNVTVSSNAPGCNTRTELDLECMEYCDGNIYHVGNIINSQYDAKTLLTSDAILLSPQSVLFQSETAVELLTGFEVQQGALFEIAIWPCVE